MRSKLLAHLVIAAATQAAAISGPPGPLTGTEPAPASVLPPAPVPAAVTLPRNTMVRLMVLKEVNSRDHAAGHRFVLRVDEDVLVDGVKVIPIGAKAWGEVTSSEGTGGVGKSGRVNARLLYVEAGGKQLRVNGERQSSGTGGTGQVIGGVVAFGLFGLLMKGNNATLKAGEILNGYTVEDTSFDRPAAAPLQH